MTKSRRREKPREKTPHSIAEKAIADRMKRAIETKGEASPEATATAKALLQKTRIDQVHDLETIGSLETAVETLRMEQLPPVGNYMDEHKLLLVKWNTLHKYIAQIAERKDFLERKQRRSAAD